MKRLLTLLFMRLSPAPIFDIAHGFWYSKALGTACELGVFTALAANPQSAEELAVRLDVPARPLSMLLNAMAALGFLRKRGVRFTNAPLAHAFLVKGKAGYLGDTVLHMTRTLYERWGWLTEVVRQGKPLHLLPGAPPQRETVQEFTLAMHGMSSFVGDFLAMRLDLRRYRQVLDIGGGSGVISVKLAEKFPNLNATVLDSPQVCSIAKELCEMSPAAKRIQMLPQSYLEPLPKGYDVAILSQVLHGESAEVCRDLIRRVYDALDSPGLIVVVEFALEEGKVGLPFPALFSLNMLINTEAGAAYSREELLQWLRAAGFKKVKSGKLPGYATLFTGQKG